VVKGVYNNIVWFKVFVVMGIQLKHQDVKASRKINGCVQKWEALGLKSDDFGQEGIG